MRKYFQISVHALVISGFIALALTGRLDAPAIFVFSAGLVYSVYRTMRNMLPPLSAHGAFLLSCGYIGFFLLDSLILSRSFIPATIHLVLFLELAKLYQEKTDKDYFYLIVLSFMQVLAASALTIDLSFVATLLVFLTALVSTLMSFDMYRSERQTTAGARNLGAALGGMSVWATGWIVVIGVGLFFVIPRIGTGYFSRAATQSLLLSGFSENVQLGEIGQVKLNSAVVMRAKLISGTRYAVLKWRGIALDTFDGHTWRKTDRKHYRIVPLNDQYLVHPVDRSGEPVRYEILLEPLATTALFAPFRLRSVSGTIRGIDTDDDDSIYAHIPSLNRLQYQVLSEVPPQTGWADRISTNASVPTDIRAKYLQLPGNLDPKVRELALQITDKAESTAEKASLVESYLRRNYKYTLNLTIPGEQPIRTFLFTTKEGDCEYFASSMAILLRTAGIPTRLINGFQMGEYNPVGNDYIVRQSDAHSWVEVYLPGRGWLEFDPTPPDPNRKEMSLGMQLSEYVDAAELYWNSYVLIYDSSLQNQLFRNAQDRVQTIQAELRDKSDRWLDRSQMFSDQVATRMRSVVEAVSFWFIVGLLALLGSVFNYRSRILTEIKIWRLRHGIGAVDGAVIAQLFYRAARQADPRHMPRKPGQTWREWLSELPDADRRTALARALEIFEKSRYGQIPSTAADFAMLDRTVRKM